VFKWPDEQSVRRAAKDWALHSRARNPNIVRIGYRGSYAVGRAGVGSDLDLVVVLKTCDLPFERRGLLVDTSSLPVPCDVLVYTEAEFAAILARGDRFAADLRDRTVWL